MSVQPLLDVDVEKPTISYGTLTYYRPIDGVIERPSWVIAAQPHVILRAKRVFPRMKADTLSQIAMFDSDEVCRELDWFMQRFPLTMDPASRLALEAGVQRHRDTEDAIATIMAGRPVDTGEVRTPAQKSRRYQIQAADLIGIKRRTIIVDELGLGKTHSGSLTFRNPDALPGLVVPQANLTLQWRRQLADIWPDLTVYIPPKGTPDAHFERWCAKNGGAPDIYVVPYSKLRGWQHHLRGVVRSVVFDEVQELRTGTGTDKGNAAAAICESAAYAVGLTATPVYNYGGELHSIYDIVAPGELGSRDEFLREWGGGVKGMQGHPTVRDPKALSLYLRDAGLMLGRTRKEVGQELPCGPPEKVPHYIDADPKVLERLSGDAIELARLILSKTTSHVDRFQASGEFDMLMRQATGIAKAPFVASFVASLIKSEATDKVVLWGWHRAVYDIWIERLRVAGIRVTSYTGEESVTQKDKAATRFTLPKSDPLAADVLIMSLRSGAGLDGIQKACNIGVFGELDWSPKVMDQCLGRIDRPGQEKQVVGYYLMSDSGADPKMVKVLDIKHAQAAPIERPDEDVLSALPDPSGRVKALAEDVLRQYGVSL